MPVRGKGKVQRRGSGSDKEYKVYVETTLLDFLLFKLGKSLSRNAIKHLLSHKQVAVNGVLTTRFDCPLYPEDTVLISRTSLSAPKKGKIKVIYEDEKILVIDKPTKLLSVESDDEKSMTAYRLASDYLRSKDPKARLYVVHRLDEDTSGVLMFSKSYEYKEALQKNWQKICLKRGYYAIVEGKLPEKGSYKDYLLVDKTGLVHLTNDKTKGKLSITRFKKMAENSEYTLLDVEIDSGRKNQIRVQLGARGHHVIGDDKYGEPADPLGRLGLHAYELSIKCPDTGKVMTFKSNMPSCFASLLGGKIKKAPR